MEMIGCCELLGYTVEAYFPERGKEDIWTLWVVKDGRVVHEEVVRYESGSPYGIDADVLAELDRVARRAVRKAILKSARKGRRRPRPAVRARA